MSDRWNKTVTVTQSAYCVCGKRHSEPYEPTLLDGTSEFACSEVCITRHKNQWDALWPPGRATLQAGELQGLMDAALANQEERR